MSGPIGPNFCLFGHRLVPLKNHPVKSDDLSMTLFSKCTYNAKHNYDYLTRFNTSISKIIKLSLPSRACGEALSHFACK